MMANSSSSVTPGTMVSRTAQIATSATAQAFRISDTSSRVLMALALSRGTRASAIFISCARRDSMEKKSSLSTPSGPPAIPIWLIRSFILPPQSLAASSTLRPQGKKSQIVPLSRA